MGGGLLVRGKGDPDLEWRYEEGKRNEGTNETRNSGNKERHCPMGFMQ